MLHTAQHPKRWEATGYVGITRNPSGRLRLAWRGRLLNRITKRADETRRPVRESSRNPIRPTTNIPGSRIDIWSPVGKQGNCPRLLVIDACPSDCVGVQASNLPNHGHGKVDAMPMTGKRQRSATTNDATHDLRADSRQDCMGMYDHSPRKQSSNTPMASSALYTCVMHMQRQAIVTAVDGLTEPLPPNLLPARLLCVQRVGDAAQHCDL